MTSPPHDGHKPESWEDDSQPAIDFLPAIPVMPTPPGDSGDVKAWEKHIEATDKYLLDLSEAIQKIENSNFTDNFKKRFTARGIDIDKDFPLSEEFGEEVSEKMQALAASSQELGRTLGIDADRTPKPRVNKSRRNIRSI